MIIALPDLPSRKRGSGSHAARELQGDSRKIVELLWGSRREGDEPSIYLVMPYFATVTAAALLRVDAGDGQITMLQRQHQLAAEKARFTPIDRAFLTTLPHQLLPLHVRDIASVPVTGLRRGQ